MEHASRTWYSGLEHGYGWDYLGKFWVFASKTGWNAWYVLGGGGGTWNFGIGERACNF